MATNVSNEGSLQRIADAISSFLDKNFVKIAFAISTVALLILQPYSFLLGSIAGFFLNKIIDPNPVIIESDRIINIMNTTTSIVGALAALVRLTPSGEMGGVIFQLLPAMFSMGAGAAAYKAFSYYVRGC